MLVCGGEMYIYTGGQECKKSKNAKCYNTLGRNTDIIYVQNLRKSIFERQEN